MRLMLHDLAQPLAILAGQVDLLLIDAHPASRQFDEMKHLSEQLQAVMEKMEDLRQLARQINSLVEN
ncbi:MAG: hypothetical protein ACUVRZ_10850 [Desulfobacca sp.]